MYGQPSPSGRSENRNSTFCYIASDDDDDDDSSGGGDGDSWQLYEKCGYFSV